MKTRNSLVSPLGIVLFMAYALLAEAVEIKVDFAGEKGPVKPMQGTRLDSAMIYDARCGLGSFSPLFNPFTYNPHKAYYAFKAFNELYRRRREVRIDADLPSGVWAVAAGTPEDGALVVANTTNDALPFKLNFSAGRVASCRLTDADHTHELVPLPTALPAHAFVVVLTK